MSHAPMQEFLSFTLGGLEYGLDARQVREWRPFAALGRFADGAKVVPGVAQSRGVIMPIVDLRAASAGDPAAGHPVAGAGRSDVIVLTLASCVMGLVVEHVNGVVPLRVDQIRAMPSVEGAAPADYLLGWGEYGARRLVLVDIDRLMAVGQDRAVLQV